MLRVGQEKRAAEPPGDDARRRHAYEEVHIGRGVGQVCLQAASEPWRQALGPEPERLP